MQPNSAPPPFNPPRIMSLTQKAKHTWGKYEKYAPAAFFILGFLFDVLTLDRIDAVFSMVQQGIYILLLGLLLSLFLFDEQKPLAVPRWLSKVWEFRTEVLHFVFGSLLSVFFLYYIKSSSLFSSLIFILLMAGLLVANELPHFQKLGVSIKYALFTVCVISYLSYVIPIFTGIIGFIPTIITVFASAAVIGGLAWSYVKLGIEQPRLRKEVLRPAIAVMLSFLVLYYFRLIPPVPLSIQYVGIYHNVAKNAEGQYLLYHQRPFWKFWHHGDQDFVAQPGDKIHCFVRIFSPTNFNDSVQLHWLFKHPQNGWQTMDKIPFQIRGGRDEGFRGYAFKSRFEPGDWRVQVETLEGHEIGRIYFDVEFDQNSANQAVAGQTGSERQFEIDTF